MHLSVNVSAGFHMPEMGWHWKIRHRMATMPQQTQRIPRPKVTFLKTRVSKTRRYKINIEIFTIVMVSE